MDAMQRMELVCKALTRKIVQRDSVSLDEEFLQSADGTRRTAPVYYIFRYHGTTAAQAEAVRAHISKQHLFSKLYPFEARANARIEDHGDPELVSAILQFEDPALLVLNHDRSVDYAAPQYSITFAIGEPFERATSGMVRRGMHALAMEPGQERFSGTSAYDVAPIALKTMKSSHAVEDLGLDNLGLI